MRHSLISLLEPLIGQTLRINGQDGIVLDVIDDPAALVLQDTCATPHLDLDYLGRTQENSMPSRTISLISEGGNAIHPDVQRQLDPHLGRALHALLFASG